jgi:carboxypeptidase PM20D1
VIAPGLSVASTDSRHYVAITANIYRFLPVRMEAEDLERLHGANERLAVAAYEKLIRFYAQLILNAAG